VTLDGRRVPTSRFSVAGAQRATRPPEAAGETFRGSPANLDNPEKTPPYCEPSISYIGPPIYSISVDPFAKIPHHVKVIVRELSLQFRNDNEVTPLGNDATVQSELGPIPVFLRSPVIVRSSFNLKNLSPPSPA
jgi:hypothetical protein